MSTWRRVMNLFRGNGLNREIDEELESHVAEAIADGRDPEEARRAFGSSLCHREASRDVRVGVWLDSLRADAIFGLRQLRKNKITSIAAVLSLGLAIGQVHRFGVGCRDQLGLLFHSSAYFFEQRIRPGVVRKRFVLQYGVTRRFVEAIRVGHGQRSQQHGVDQPERCHARTYKAQVQYVSGWMFPSFGLRPKLERLLSENDNAQPGGHPFAVLSQDYWKSRFGEDPSAVGRTFRIGDRVYEIVGVIDGKFTGTEPGKMVDIFIPVMMHPGVTANDWGWLRTLVILKPGAAEEPVRAKMEVITRTLETQRMNGATDSMPQHVRDAFLNQQVWL